MNMLRERLSALAPLVSGAIIHSADALVSRDEALARRISAEDSRLSDLCLEIEVMAYNLMRLGRLKDRDLHFTLSAVMVGHALIQIGDHAANVAHLALRAIGSGEHNLPAEAAQDLSEMACSAAEMVNDAVRAFVDGDARLAESTVRRDRELDESFERLSGVGETRYESAEQHRLMLWIISNFRQIGVGAANICERVIFVATGEIKEFH